MNSCIFSLSRRNPFMKKLLVILLVLCLIVIFNNLL